LYPLLALSTKEESGIKDNDLAYFNYWPCIFVEKLRKHHTLPMSIFETHIPTNV
jgi:hypothetical protein